MCSECDGTGKSAMAMPLYHGSLLKHGLLWAFIVVALWWVVSLFSNSWIYSAAVSLIWTVAWWLVLYRNKQRHERRHDQP